MFNVELCASVLVMQQEELALYALRQGFARINISYVELRDKHRVGVLLFDRLAILPCPVNLPVKKQVELVRETLQRLSNRTSDQEASSRLAV